MDVGEHIAIVALGVAGAAGFVVLVCSGHPAEGAALILFIGGLMAYVVGKSGNKE